MGRDNPFLWYFHYQNGSSLKFERRNTFKQFVDTYTSESIVTRCWRSSRNRLNDLQLQRHEGRVLKIFFFILYLYIYSLYLCVCILTILIYYTEESNFLGHSHNPRKLQKKRAFVTRISNIYIYTYMYNTKKRNGATGLTRWWEE